MKSSKNTLLEEKQKDIREEIGYYDRIRFAKPIKN